MVASVICLRCKKPLTNPASIARGLGDVCAKHECHQVDAFDDCDAIPDTPALPDVEEHFVFQRDADGNARTSVVRRCVDHSPTGFEWGYGGSGPADLAMNIMLHFLPVAESKFNPVIIRWNKHQLSREAQALYQDFKNEVIGLMPTSGGTIRKDFVKEWIDKKLPEKELEQHFDWDLK